MSLTPKERNSKYFKKLNKERPWVVAHHNALSRCRYKSVNGYHRYGGRGIKMLLTKDEVRDLWIRDKAATMKIPTLDRINNDGNYEYKNCRFIEKSENTLRKPVWRPEKCASKYMGVCRGRRGKWLAQIQVMGRRYWLGEFKTEIDASKAYENAKKLAINN